MGKRTGVQPYSAEAVERIMLRVSADQDGCWIWSGGKTASGYGQISLGSVASGDAGSYYTHRVMYTVLVGPIVDGLHIDHLCRVRSCCNPEHLEAVTRKVNILRGHGAAARQLRKTHCDHGHEFNEANTYRPPGRPDIRVCRTCRSAMRQRSRLARRAVA